MKKFRYLALSAAAALLSLSSCSEDPLDVFGQEHYVHFTRESERSYNFSFATIDGDEYTLEIPVTLIGRSLEEDITYNVEVVKTGEVATTASDGVFTVTSENVFHKGTFEDVLSVQLHNMPELSEERTVVLRITDKGVAKAGPEEYQTALIRVSNTLSKPDWWSSDITKVFLGEYSDIKYQEFIKATGMIDLTDLSTAKVRTYTIAFVYYLRDLDVKGQTAYEKDGITKVLDTVPYNKNL